MIRSGGRVETHGHVCSTQGCGRVPLRQLTRLQHCHQVLRDSRDAAWHGRKKMMELFGNRAVGALSLMSIYLRGACSCLPFYLSLHIWCPDTRRVCFHSGCRQFIYTDPCTCCCECNALEEPEPSAGMRFYLYVVFFYLFID